MNPVNAGPSAAPGGGIDLEQLAKASHKAALISAISAAVFLSSLAYSAWTVRSSQAQLVDIHSQLKAATGALEDAQKNLSTVQAKTTELSAEIAGLEASQALAVATLGEVLQADRIAILDPDVHFTDIQKDFEALKPGRRKQAMLAAILYAWKSVPFVTGGQDMNVGLGSVEFLLQVLGHVGIKIADKDGMLRSQSAMDSMSKVDEPQVGDIAFYGGSVGAYGVFVISLGATSGGPVGLGGYNETLPVQIRSLNKGNRAKHPFLGYFRPDYEQPPTAAPAS